MRLQRKLHSRADFERVDSFAERPHSGRRGRLFESGRMKGLVLYLINQSPKHGYEIIKEISELVGGGYTPSAGTIYPTLSFLEDMGLIATENSEADRKQYHITEAGKLRLQERGDMIKQLLEKLETKREIQSNDKFLDIHRAMENLKTALRLQLGSKELDAEKIRKIAENIDQAAVEIGRL